MARRKRINIRRLVLPAVFAISIIAIIVACIIIANNNSDNLPALTLFGRNKTTTDAEDEDDEENTESSEAEKSDFVREAEAVYQKVSEYDFSKGRNDSLAKEITNVFQDTYYDIYRESHAIAIKAKTDYYFGIGKYHTALTTVDEMEDYYQNKDDILYMLGKKVEIYKALGNESRAAAYQNEYNLEANEGKCGGA